MLHRLQGDGRPWSIKCVRAESITMDAFVAEFDFRHDNGKLVLREVYVSL